MRLSKSQIDEFSAHIQHEFGQSKMVVRFFPRKPKPPPDCSAPFTLRSIQNRDHILRSNFANDGDDSKAGYPAQREKWEGQIIGKSAQSSIIIHGEELAVGTNASQVIYSSANSSFDW